MRSRCSIVRPQAAAAAVLAAALVAGCGGFHSLAGASSSVLSTADTSTGSLPLGADAPSAGGIAGAPLVVGGSTHVVVLEYEAWFGPGAVTFQNAEAMPWLQSQDMQQVGGGYDSADPHVIAQHVRWMQYMGVDAVTLDLTNNVGCIFSTGPVSPKFCDPVNQPFRENNRNIQANDGNIYAAWTQLGTSLKVIPLLGCQTQLDLNKGSDGKSGFQKEVEYFGGFMNRYPGLSLRYDGHPL